MKENKDIEKILLKDSSFEDMIKTKIEQEFLEELKISQDRKNKKIITDIKEVPIEKIFSKEAVYEVINKNSRTKSYINGIQAEGYLGGQTSARENLLNRISNSFVCGNSYVKFYKIKI